MTSAVASSSPDARPPLRLVLLLGLFGLELFLAARLYTTPPEFGDAALDWAQPLLRRQMLFGPLLFGALVGLALAHARLGQLWQELLDAHVGHSLRMPLVAQCLACAACFGLAFPLYFQASRVGDWGWPLLGLWAACVLACAVLSLWALAPMPYWRRLLARERRSVFLAVLGAALGALMLEQLFRAWGPAALLTRLTLTWCGLLLGQIYPDAFADPASAILGTPQFSVLISSACSGYLGVGLTLGVLACYCYVFRAEIRPWVMLVMVPMAITLSLALNVVRIVALVVLGVEVSPQVAVNGFHTNAGSIFMVLTCATLVGLVHWGVVARPRRGGAAVERLGWTLDYESALLVPMLVLLAATLLTGAFSGTFVWLYPLRVVAVALALAWCWPHLRHLPCAPSLGAVLIGVAVFGLWLVLVPPHAELDGDFARALGSVSPGVALAWLAARVLGAAVMVPMAEELAFRGYLLTLLSRQPLKPGAPLPFHALGFGLSSLLFGLLHGQWLAGALAGAAYAWARYRRGQLWDAVLAHMTTNLLLAGYVLFTRQWSYW